MVNPLTKLSYPIPFSAIQPEHFEAASHAAIETTKRNLSLLLASKVETLSERISRYGALTEELERTWDVVRHLDDTCSTPAIRTAYEKIEPSLSQFSSELLLNPDLFRVIKELRSHPGLSQLSTDKQRLVERTFEVFSRNGAGLEEAKRHRLAQIDVSLAEACLQFRSRVLDATNAFELLVSDEGQLLGMPPDAIAAARAGGAAKGQPGYRLTLQAPCYLAVMQHCRDRGIRESIYRAFSSLGNGGEFDTRALVRRILSLRSERAALLGFSHYGDLATGDRMVKCAARVQEFLKDIGARVLPRLTSEHEELSRFAATQGLKKIEPWDLPFYAERLQEERFSLTQEELRPYFPFTKALRGIFDLGERLFGVSIKEDTSIPVWHPEVKSFAVREPSGALRGIIHVDYFPRESKRAGAWMNQLLYGRREEGEPHVVLMCGNFNPPVDGSPSLLTHDEVCTLAHEFGHILHGVLSDVPFRQIGGTNVPLDFVEVPSQLFENWCWEEESIKLLSGHVATGDPLPAAMLEKLRQSRNFRQATHIARQIGFGTMDMALHTEPVSSSDEALVTRTQSLLQPFTPVPIPERSSMVTSFSHLFGGAGGYAAGYYSYLWSEVMEAQIFERFKREGLLSRRVGEALRSTILARGEERDVEVAFREFTGEAVSPDAFLRRSGLV